jgi:hypothetical protein
VARVPCYSFIELTFQRNSSLVVTDYVAMKSSKEINAAPKNSASLEADNLFHF